MSTRIYICPHNYITIRFIVFIRRSTTYIINIWKITTIYWQILIYLNLSSFSIECYIGRSSTLHLYWHSVIIISWFNVIILFQITLIFICTTIITKICYSTFWECFFTIYFIKIHDLILKNNVHCIENFYKIKAIGIMKFTYLFDYTYLT